MSLPVVDDRVPVAVSHRLHQPYIPATESPRELTIRGLVLGSVLGIVFAASSVYLAVKVGMTVSASIPIAVLSIAVFRALGNSSILENTIVQTTGSAGESLAFGIAVALPALLFLGYDIDLTHAFLLAAFGGVLGVLMMIPLRYGLIVQEHGKLAYPEGTACAEVLIAGEQGGTNAKTVIAGFVTGLVYKFAYQGLKLWREAAEVTLGGVTKTAAGIKKWGYAGASASIEVSPELLGVGYIIGPKIAGVTFAGGVLSYLVLIPIITFFGANLDVPLLSPDGTLIRDMSPSAIRNTYVLYIGAGAVATGGVLSLLRSFPTIFSAFRRGIQTFLDSRSGKQVQMLRTEQDLPITVVLVGVVGLILAIWLLPPLHVNFLAALLIIVFGFFFVTVSSRITGEIGSSSNPISGMVVATLLFTCLVFLLLGWTSPADRFMALSTAAIVGIAASNGGTTAQDLKTAYLVGGTPRRQQIALFVGVLTSALFIGGTLWTLNNGATVIIPEAHPGVQATEIVSEGRTQKVFAFAPDESRMAAQGLDRAKLRRGAWAAGYELREEGGALSLRTFTEGLDIQNATVEGSSGQVKFSELGTLTPGKDLDYRYAYVRDTSTAPTGKYLADGQGTLQYLVDPGIGGRISEFEGRKYTRYDAPKARLFSLIIDGILTQKLPWDLVLLGVFIALMLELCGVSSLPFAVGVYLPISTTAPIFVGGLVRYFVDRLRGKGKTDAESEFSPGVLLSSGYIAGGAIAGVLVAFMMIPKDGAILQALNIPEHVGGIFRFLGEHEAHSPLGSNLFALAVFGLLVAFLLRTGLKGESGATAPAKK